MTVRLVDELNARGLAVTVDRHADRRGLGQPATVTVDTVDPMPGSDLLGVAMFGPNPAAVAVTASGRVWVLTSGQTGRIVVEDGADPALVDLVAEAVSALTGQPGVVLGVLDPPEAPKRRRRKAAEVDETEPVDVEAEPVESTTEEVDGGTDVES